MNKYRVSSGGTVHEFQSEKDLTFDQAVQIFLDETEPPYLGALTAVRKNHGISEWADTADTLQRLNRLRTKAKEGVNYLDAKTSWDDNVDSDWPAKTPGGL